MPCHWSKAYCTCFWPDAAQVHRILSTLLDFQLIFVVFLANQRSSIVPPYTPQRMPTHGENPSTLHTPHHVMGATQVSAYCLHTSAEIDTTYGYQFCTVATDASLLPHPKSSMRDLCYDAGNSCCHREAGRYVCCSCSVV